VAQKYGILASLYHNITTVEIKYLSHFSVFWFVFGLVTRSADIRRQAEALNFYVGGWIFFFTEYNNFLKWTREKGEKYKCTGVA